MDGYFGSDDILEKLEFALYDPCRDLYWGDVMELLRKNLNEIKQLREIKHEYENLQK